jgi:hypothetical protein
MHSLEADVFSRLLTPVSAKPRVQDRIVGMTKKVLSATAAQLDELMAAEVSVAARRRV